MSTPQRLQSSRRVMAEDETSESVSLDVLYAPSRWSTRLSADVIVDKHIEVLHEGES